jgi:hypothetical protein
MTARRGWVTVAVALVVAVVVWLLWANCAIEGMFGCTNIIAD